ncbi:hypothetical protein [Kitasatospora sp. NPDC093806]|uniref:hypothetical protein n=1 Tax=Kitasatospora sp. NPDC093806 TaxID=3155075 RepID=UPI00341906BC
MRRRHRAAAATAVAAAVAAVGVATWQLSTGRDELRYADDYARHEPLRVVGYPSVGSLRLTQEVVWRLADGSSGELADLATSDGSAAEAKATAANWVRSFQQGATGPVAAEFHDEGSVRQTVVLYFERTGQVKQLNLRLDGNAGSDGWRVQLREPDPKVAAAPPTWAPATPGGPLPPTRP